MVKLPMLPGVDFVKIALDATRNNTEPADMHTVLGALLHAQTLESDAQHRLLKTLMNDLGDESTLNDDFRAGMMCAFSDTVRLLYLRRQHDANLTPYKLKDRL